MAFTPPPTPPNSGDPANFNARADAFLAWFPTFVADFNSELPLLRSASWAVRGGSANAITLTAGFTALPTGMQVRFRATAANTGAATINLDGLGARQCRTITGLALPAGYIRTDVDTLATYDGTYWVLDRQIERGSNANGDYVRLADGSQFCRVAGLTFVYSTASEIRYSWTYPAPFSDGPLGQLSLSTTGADYVNVSPGNIGPLRHSSGGTSAVYILTRTTGTENFTSASEMRNARLGAEGAWY